MAPNVFKKGTAERIIVSLVENSVKKLNFDIAKSVKLKYSKAEFFGIDNPIHNLQVPVLFNTIVVHNYNLVSRSDCESTGPFEFRQMRINCGKNLAVLK